MSAACLVNFAVLSPWYASKAISFIFANFREITGLGGIFWFQLHRPLTNPQSSRETASYRIDAVCEGSI